MSNIFQQVDNTCHEIIYMKLPFNNHPIHIKVYFSGNLPAFTISLPFSL